MLKHKEDLLARKIRRFDENNWWQWGRAHHESKKRRIYVNTKTRRASPFFLRKSCDYDGAMLALFPLDNNVNLPNLCDLLNAVNWEELGFVCDGRFLFGQRSLQCCMLPKSFSRYVKTLFAA